MTYFPCTASQSLSAVLPEILCHPEVEPYALRVVADLAYDPSSLTRFASPEKGLRVFFSAAPFINFEGRETAPNLLLERARLAGADLIIYEPDGSYPVAEPHFEGGALFIPARSCRSLLARASARFYQVPDIAVFGVTGTKGKTSVSYAIHMLLRRLFERPGLVGTASYYVGATEVPNASSEINGVWLTSLESLELSGFIATNKLDALVLEATSHALVLDRVSASLGVSTAVVTNLHPEHLSFHGSYESYREAKARLVDLVAGYRGMWPRLLVLNGNDEEAPLFFERAKAAGLRDSEIVVVATGGSEQFLPRCDYRFTASSTDVEIEHGGSARRFVRPDGPAFLSLNRILALATVDAFSRRVSGREILSAGAQSLVELPSPPGRFEVVSSSPLAIVDYAHEPYSMQKVLEYVREAAGAPVVILSGYSGRTRSQRAELARVVSQYAVRVVLTSEGTGGEPIEQIIDDFLSGLEGHSGVEVILDRGSALQRAADLLMRGAGACLVSSSVGSESRLRYGEEIIPWDEVAVLRSCLDEARKNLPARARAGL